MQSAVSWEASDICDSDVAMVIVWDVVDRYQGVVSGGRAPSSWNWSEKMMAGVTIVKLII